MKEKSESNMRINQILEISLIMVIIFLCSVSTYIEVSSKETAVLTEEFIEIEEGIVPNDETDYVQYVQSTYLSKKEFVNNENVEEERVIVEENVSQETIVNEEIKEEKKEEIVKNIEIPPEEYKEILEVKATAYCLCKKCCGKSESHPEYGVTASGLKIIPGTNMKVIAVDTNVVPLGSRVYVEGLNGASDYGYAIASDTGSAIKNKKIDLYMDTHEQARKWGVKNVKLYVIE